MANFVNGDISALSGRPFEEVKEQLRGSLKQGKIQEARQDYLKGLRKGSDVTILLAPPRVQVGFDPKRLRGNPKAQVMIVEFSDFQCPYCRRVEATLKGLLSQYGDHVSLAYRDYPLIQLHPQAELAAEASRCAGEQGKFWEYHDRLISENKLELAALLEYARTFKLDEKQFDACMSTQKYRTEVQRDLEEGTEAGVTGTPGFFINGVPFSGAQSPEALPVSSTRSSPGANNLRCEPPRDRWRKIPSAWHPLLRAHRSFGQHCVFVSWLGRGGTEGRGCVCGLFSQNRAPNHSLTKFL
jgi:protein-disulfide isomerase